MFDDASDLGHAAMPRRMTPTLMDLLVALAFAASTPPSAAWACQMTLTQGRAGTLPQPQPQLLRLSFSHA